MSRCGFGDVSVMSRSCLCLFLVMSRCCFVGFLVVFWGSFSDVLVTSRACFGEVSFPEHRVLILINKLINISIDIDFVCFY